MPLTFNDSSKNLKETEIVPTLETVVDTRKNVVWSASFLSAWKTMEDEIVGGPVLLEEARALAASLNDATDPRLYVPSNSIFAMAATNGAEFAARATGALRFKFPNEQPSSFPDIVSNGFVAYSFIQMNMKFVMPYNQNKEPLDFARFGGSKIEVNSFGIPNEDQNTYFKLRSQAKILFSDRDRSNNFEFAIDLCANSPRDQIVVAKIAPCSSLFLSLEYIAAKTLEMKTRLNGEESEEAKYQQSIQPLDSLLVPNFNWRISHHFSELEGRKFIDPKFSKQYISVAQEDIVFELQKGGAELVAESKIYYKPTRRHFDLDGPFLLYLKSRDAVSPYFVMWIANGELLSPFQKGNEKE